MSVSRNGVSILEVMVALVVLTVGVLGVAGTMVLAWRAELAGERASVASRVAGSILDSLRTEVVDGDGRCDRLRPGSESAAHATLAAWSSAASSAGHDVLLTLSFASLASSVTDTVWTFIPCR